MIPRISMSFDDPYEETGSFWGSIKHAASSVGHAASSVAKTVAKPVSSAVHAVEKVPILGTLVHATETLYTGPLALAHSIISGERIDHALIDNFKRQAGAIKDIAPYAQTVVSFVPGVGTGLSGAIGAATALASGKTITQALLEAAKGALPGGPLARSAFDIASAAAQGKSISNIALAGLPIPDSQKDIIRQSVQVAKDIASGKRIDKIILDRVNANLSKLPGDLQKAVQVGVALGHGANIQKTLVSAGSSALLSKAGKMNIPTLQTAARAIEGASKGGIQKAIGAAQALKSGSPVLRQALHAASSHFPAGSHGYHGFSTAVKVLSQTSGNKGALAAARRSLPSVAAQHAFDAAIGTVAQTVSANPSALARRAGATFSPNMGRAKGVISPYQPNLKNAIDSLKRNPTLASQHPLVLANKFGTTQQTVLQALKHVSTQRLLPWRSLSPAAMRFVSKWHPNAPMRALGHGTDDTAGLDETGTKYIFTKGDSPFSIALKLTGNGNNWTQLKSLNTDKKPSIDKNVWVGEVLNIPASWQKPTAKQSPSPGPAVLSQPSIDRPAVVTTPAPQLSTAPGILQAKAILVAWSKTDGVNQAGLTDYGSTAADLSTDFGARDSMELMAFQSWDNKTANAGLVVDGKLGPASLAKLQQWAESRATQSAPAIPGNVTTLPEVVIEASAPVVSAGIPQLSPAPTVSTPVLSVPAPAIPPVATKADPATPATVASNTPAASGSKMAPALAGAAVGGVLFGLPGALIGGIAGAAIA